MSSVVSLAAIGVLIALGVWCSAGSSCAHAARCSLSAAWQQRPSPARRGWLSPRSSAVSRGFRDSGCSGCATTATARHSLAVSFSNGCPPGLTRPAVGVYPISRQGAGDDRTPDRVHRNSFRDVACESAQELEDHALTIQEVVDDRTEGIALGAAVALYQSSSTVRRRGHFHSQGR